MKTLAITICTAALLWACEGKKDASKTAPAKETTATPVKEAGAANEPAPALDSATKAKNMMEFAMPGDMHKMMAKWDGSWASEIKMYMAPDAPPMTMNSKAVNKMINNGLVQQSTHAGSFMGAPFNGISQMGYDNHRKMFWSTWIDNFGSGLVYMEGTWDEAAKAINLKGKMTDPETKQQVDMREVLKMVDDNTQQMEQYITHDGKEAKSMEITFKRTK